VQTAQGKMLARANRMFGMKQGVGGDIINPDIAPFHEVFA